MAISDRQLKLAQECINYVEKLIKKAEEKLERAQDKHELEGIINTRTIDKYERELEMFDALIKPQKLSVWKWQEEHRPSEFTDEQLKEMWERDNGRSVDE